MPETSVIAEHYISPTQPSDAPHVTIGLPVYNGAQTLRRALDSLLASTYPNFELIISDNGSTDGTLEICRHYAASDPRVKLIMQPENKGALTNFAAVLEDARGPYFMWAADDDVWQPGFVTTMVAELEKHPEACVSMCATSRVHESGAPLDIIRFPKLNDEDGANNWSRLHRLMGPEKLNLYIYGLFRTDIVKKAMPYFPDALGGDRQFLCQFASAYPFRYVDRILYVRTHRLDHELKYKEQQVRPRVVLNQISKFMVNFLFSPIVPLFYKLFFPYVLFVYSTFVLGKRTRHVVSRILAYAQRMVLRAALWGAIALSCAVLFLIVRSLTKYGLDFSLWPRLEIGIAILGIIVVSGMAFMVRLIGQLGRLLLRLDENFANLKKHHGSQEKRIRTMSKDMRYQTDLLLQYPNENNESRPVDISPYALNRTERMRKAIKFARNLEQSQIRELFIQEIFPNIEKAMLPIGAINELTGHPNKVDMLYVCAMAQNVGAKNIFEFGTYQGRTSYHFTYAGDDTIVTTLNLPVDQSGPYKDFIGSYFRGTEREARIRQVFEDSRKFDTSPHRGKYDFIFVDGDHSYEMVKNDTIKAFELLKPGGMVVWHDYAPKSEGLVQYMKELSETKHLFRVKRTCLLVYIDGVDSMTFQPIPMRPSLELEHMKSEPYQIEELYHA